MGTGDTIIPTIQLFIAYRKLTDEIHKYETRLDTLKLDLEEHNTKLAELEKIAQQAQSHHDRNSQALELMKDSSGWLYITSLENLQKSFQVVDFINIMSLYILLFMSRSSISFEITP